MTKDGQYDDLETPANRMLLDDKKISSEKLN
jgi:cbb3-type cytochrome oxidase maturation protein